MVISPWLVIIGASRFNVCWKVVDVVCISIVGVIFIVVFCVIVMFIWVVIQIDCWSRGHSTGVGPVNRSRSGCVISAIVAGIVYSFSFVFHVNVIRGIVVASIRGMEWVCDLCTWKSASRSGIMAVRDAMKAFLGFTPIEVKVM